MGAEPAPQAKRGQRSHVKRSEDRRRKPEPEPRAAGQGECVARALGGAPAFGDTTGVQPVELPSGVQPGEKAEVA